MDFTTFFAFAELPFLIIALIFGFITARKLRGGIFGKGMNLIAWGFLVMAVGHLHMFIDKMFGFNLFNSLLGETGGTLAWILALMVTWGLSGLGFWSMYKASDG